MRAFSCCCCGCNTPPLLSFPHAAKEHILIPRRSCLCRVIRFLCAPLCFRVSLSGNPLPLLVMTSSLSWPLWNKHNMPLCSTLGMQFCEFVSGGSNCICSSNLTSVRAADKPHNPPNRSFQSLLEVLANCVCCCCCGSFSRRASIWHLFVAGSKLVIEPASDSKCFRRMKTHCGKSREHTCTCT